MDNDVLTRNENGELSVRTVGATEQASVVNPDDVYTRTMEGYLAVRTVGGSGGGGSDAHNLGYYETLAALQAAHPTAEAGDWAIVAESDTVYIWDATQRAWVDTDQKGQVESVNGKTGVVVLNATDVEAIPQYTSMPLASSNNANFIVQYKGATNSTYTNGYFYKNVANIVYTGTVSFEAASLSGTTVACSGDNFANFLTESGVSPLSVVSGTITYDATGSLWVLVGKNADDEMVLTFQEYQEDYEDFGFTFTGTPQDGDVIAFTCTVQEASASYAWNRIDVQPNTVNSVNGKIGVVVLSPSDIGAATAAQGAKADTAIQSVKTINGQSIVGEGNVDLEQIQVSALPTASADELGNIYQYIGATDSTYANAYFYKCVSDGQSPATYSWIQVEVQPAGSSLPSQTGQSGKFLTTDGIDASWSDKPLVNTATGTNSLTILGTAATNSYSINIGLSSSLSSGAHQTVVGDSAKAIGSSSNYATVLGAGATARNAPLGIAIGAMADANANHAIQIGTVSGQSSTTNSSANTFKVANANGNFEMMSADGTIPKERLANVVTIPSTMPELTVAGWSNNTQTVTATGVTATNTVFVSPAPVSAADYASAGIICTAQGTDSLTFTCTTVPSNAITVNVVIL